MSRPLIEYPAISNSSDRPNDNRHQKPHMIKSIRLLGTLSLLAFVAALPGRVIADSDQSTRITDPKQHQRTGSKSYPYRVKREYILKELDLKEGDVVVDVGAGDGWWAEQFAKRVGAKGTIHAGEVAEKKVEQMKKKFADAPQVKPYLIPKDGTGLPENSCDLAFFSQTYHHLNKDGHVAYLKHLSSVIKPTGRVAIIEKYTETGLGSGTHGTKLSRLVRQAEEAGWVPVRLELMTGTYHYIGIRAQKELFPPEPKKQPKSKQLKDAVTGLMKKTDAAMAKPLIIDVRTQEEWDEGHLQSAIHIPHDEIADEIAKHAKDKQRKIVLYCRSGGRAGVALQALKKLGYTNVENAGGFNDVKKRFK